MSLTPSKMIELGSKAPDFSLINVDSTIKSYSECKGERGTLVFFICNHCPYVIHINEGLVSLANDYINKEIGFVAINSNDVDSYPEDSPEKMKELAANERFPFPYLFDEDQSVAKAYDAACTPDFFLYNSRDELVYRGQLDRSRPGSSIPVTGESLRDALDLLLMGKSVEASKQIPSSGCNIKWK